jgi:hypothetical protein
MPIFLQSAEKCYLYALEFVGVSNHNRVQSNGSVHKLRPEQNKIRHQ